MTKGLQALALASVLFAGCAADTAMSDDTSSTSQAVTTENKIAMNKIAMNKIAMNKIAMNKIAMNKIAMNGLERYDLSADALTMISTDDGREVFSYLVGCALPANVTLTGAVNGTAYSFPGSIGLAPEWVRRSLDTESQHWVSACMLARVNTHNISLLISLRGPTHALGVTSSEAQTYSLQEGAFYGQLFVPDDQDILTYACEGRAQAAGEPETGPLHDRDCTEPAGDGLTQCGMTFTGTCADFTATPSRHGDDDDEGGAPHACENQSFSGFYNDCHTQASDADGQFPRHSEYDEVITVYVSP